VNLPQLGFGCSPFRRSGRTVDLTGPLRVALESGYRLFDLAELYGNERPLGAVLSSRVAPPREELFLVGKVWRTHLEPEAILQACRRSLSRLGTDYFDLYLIHAPGAWADLGPLGELAEAGRSALERTAFPRDSEGRPRLSGVPLEESWAAMRDLVSRGFARAVGVCNFDLADLELLSADPPAVHQIPRQPFDPARATVEYCERMGIRLMAHSPLSEPGLLEAPELRAAAAAAGVTPAQAVLRWHVQRGIVPVVSSTDPAHIGSNLAVLDLELPPETMALLDGMERSAPSP
jgi:diketogulonate reductase-like aldo/keto reductase